MAEPTASQLEGDLRPVLLLCDRLSALLGSATTSALLRRALAQLAPLTPALAAVRVLDRDVIRRRAVAVRNAEARPAGGDARPQPQPRALQAEALDDRAARTNARCEC